MRILGEVIAQALPGSRVVAPEERLLRRQVGQRVLLARVNVDATQGVDVSGVGVDLIQIDVDGLQVLQGHLRLVAAPVVVDDSLVGLDRFLGLVLVVINQTQLHTTFGRQAPVGVAGDQLAESLGRLGVVLQEDIGTAFLVEGVVGILGLGIVADQLVHDTDLARIVFLQAHHETFLVEGVVGGRGVGSCSPGVAGLCLGKATVIEAAVAQPVVAVGEHRTLRAAIVRRGEASEPGGGAAVVVLLEVGVAQVVEGEAVGAGVGACVGLGKVGGEVRCCLCVVAQAVGGFAAPVVCVGAGAQVVSAQLERAVEVGGGSAEVGVDKRLYAKAEEDFLLGFEDACARLAELLDRAQGGVVAAGVHVDLDEVVVHLLAVGRVGELVEEPFEDGDGLCEGRVGGLVDAECVVVERLFLHLRVVVHERCLLECELCLPFVLKLEEGESHVEVGVLRERVLDDGGASEVVARPLPGSVAVVAQTELVERVAFGVIGVADVGLQGTEGVVIASLSVVRSTEDALHLVPVVAVRTDADVASRHLFRLGVLSLPEVDVGDVVGCLAGILAVVLQALEHGEGVGVASLGIVDVGAVEVDVALVLGRAGLYDAEQGISLVEVSRLDVCDGEVEGHLVAFLVAESVELAAFEAAYGVLVVLFTRFL